MIEFEVLDGGTLRIADFQAAETRAEFYEDLSSGWYQSPKNLAGAMEECVPLSWELQSIYSDYREDLQGILEDSECDETPDEQKIARLQRELDSLPEEPEAGVRTWLLSTNDDYFSDVVVKRVEEWLSSPPNWTFESDYLSDAGTAEGIAYSYFRVMDFDQLKSLGVEVIEGEHPGSTYYAAELRCSVEHANAEAKSLGIPVHFVKH